MTSNSTKLPVLGSDGEIAVGLLDGWFDPIEAGLRDRVRDFIQTMIESELEAVLARRRYARRPKADPENNGAGGVAGHRHGHRSRSPDIPNPMPSCAYCSISSNSRCQRSRHPKSPPLRLLRNPRRSETFE